MQKGTVIQVWVGQFNAQYYEGYVLEDANTTLRMKAGGPPGKVGKHTFLWSEICFVRMMFDPADKTANNSGEEQIYRGGTYFEGAEHRLRNLPQLEEEEDKGVPYDPLAGQPTDDRATFKLYAAAGIGALLFLWSSQ